MDELRAGLELAEDEELQQLTEILFCKRFNPLDYLQMPNPIEIQSQDYNSWLDSLEKRFRFLAADGLTVLKRQSQQVSYRQILIQVCHYLKIPYSNSMNTLEIESEIFLNLLQKAWHKLPSSDQKCIRNKVVESLANSPSPQPLPVQLQYDPLKILAKGSGIIAVSSIVRPWLLQKIAQQFALHVASYQFTKSVLVQGGASISTHFAIQTAKRGVAINAVRYGATRSIFAFLGPVLWGWFLADLGWKAIATNYTRIIPVIFTIAQIRLIREI